LLRDSPKVVSAATMSNAKGLVLSKDAVEEVEDDDEEEKNPPSPKGSRKRAAAKDLASPANLGNKGGRGTIRARLVSAMEEASQQSKRFNDLFERHVAATEKLAGKKDDQD